VLFDEVEKAHPEVLNILLQLLDDGRLTDAQGRTVDFRNTIVIMTSNLGSPHLAGLPDRLANVKDVAERGRIREQAREAVMEEVRRHFRPELINRIDEIVIFNPLTREHIKQIVDIQLRGLRQRLEERSIELVLTDAAKEHLAREGFDPVYGARPLKRAIQREIVQPLAMRVLRGEIHDRDRVTVDVRNGVLEFLGEPRSRPDEPEKEAASVGAGSSS
jgi:ATP-dependent Clp protease ATP-binding subunit ClpB